MSSDKHTGMFGQRIKMLQHEIAYDSLYAWSTKSARILAHERLPLLSYFKCHNIYCGIEPFGFYRYATSTESHIPQYTIGMESQLLDAQQSEGHLGHHLGSAIKYGEILVGYSHGNIFTEFFLQQYAAVWLCKRERCRLFNTDLTDMLRLWVSQVFANGYFVVVITIVQQVLCNGSRRMVTVCETSYLLFSSYQCRIEGIPWSSCERYKRHVVIGQNESMCQHLEGMKRGYDADWSLRKLSFQRCCKTIE